MLSLSRWTLAAAAVSILRTPPAAGVATEHLLRTRNQLFPDQEPSWQPDEVNAVIVAGAEVALADYALLRRDFPGQLAHLGNADINSWLMEHAAVMREDQLAPRLQDIGLHTRIPVHEGHTRQRRASGRTQYAPLYHGRALIAEVPGGFIDAKGTGTTNASLASHSSGVMLAGGPGAIAEAMYERLTSEILQLVGSTFSTVGTYAVLRIPVQRLDGALDEDPFHWYTNPNRTTNTLAIYLRQVHRKCHHAPYSLACGAMIRHMEYTIRPFGLTSTVNYTRVLSGYPQGDIQDAKDNWVFSGLQCTHSSDIVDFGTYLTRARFTRRTANFSFITASAAQRWAAPPLLTMVESPQPDECYAVDFEHWGGSGIGQGNANTYVCGTSHPYPLLVLLGVAVT